MLECHSRQLTNTITAELCIFAFHVGDDDDDDVDENYGDIDYLDDEDVDFHAENDDDDGEVLEKTVEAFPL